MNGLKNNWKNLLVTLAVCAAAFMIFMFNPMRLSFVNMNPTLAQSMTLLCELVLFIAAAFILKKTNVLKGKMEGFGTGILVGIVPVAMLVMAVPTLLGNIAYYGSIMTIPFTQFLMFAMNCVLIGICEELLFRGLIQNALHDFFGEDTQAHVRAAILIQAVLFGVFHFSNIITAGAGFMSILLQAISAIGIGALFGAVYYRSGKNLWAAAAVHAIVDFRGFIISGALTGTTAAESVGSYASSGVSPLIMIAVVSIMTLFYIGIAMFATRKKKMEPLLQTAGC